MKTCPKCGRANSPTRKFCMRCGASLLKSLEEETPEPEQAKPASAAPQPDVSKTEEAKISTDDRWARPSQVEKDRVRTTPVKKTEMEKAMEVFSKADQVTPQESQSGIVEERMLRASEVHELLEKMQSEQPVSQPEVTEKPVAKIAPPGVTEAPPSQTTPPGVSGAPPTAPSLTPKKEPSVSMESSAPEQVIESMQKPPEPIEKTSEPIQRPPPIMRGEDMKPPASETAPVSIGTSTLDRPVSEIEKIIAEIPDYRDDEEVKDYITRLTPLYVELKVVKSELESVTAHLEDQVQKARNAAEVKRIAYENLQEQIRLTKDEYEHAKKECDGTEKRKDKELSTRNKRIEDIEKRIGRGKAAIEKRVKKLEKERSLAKKE